MLFLVPVESGGYFLTKVVRQQGPANDLQKGFFRAGHAHAAVLLVLSILILLVLDQVEPIVALELVARNGVPLAAILMPAGFFLSVTGKNPERPNRLIALLWLGAGSLTAGLLAAWISLVIAGVSGL